MFFAAVVAASTQRGIDPGMPLSEALLVLQRRGLNLVFSSQVVTAEMRVLDTPKSTTSRRMLEELLAPHPLGVVEGTGGVLVIVRREKKIEAAPPVTEVPSWAEEIEVHPSRISLLVDEPGAPVSLSREELQALPKIGDDVFRTLTLLPGATSNDVSAEVHIRGGRRDELQILLDGQELYEPYHLRDFDNALSIVGASALARVHLITAAFPVNYGDRMAGVLNMATVTPPQQRRLRIAAGLLGAEIDTAEICCGGKLGWIAAIRRGSTDLIGRAFDVEDPRFWDAFTKMHFEITPRHNLHAHVLAARDSLAFQDDEEISELDTEYDSSYFWVTEGAALGRNGFVESTASLSRVRRDRRGREDDPEREFRIRDERRFDVTRLAQVWNFQAGQRNFVTAGFEHQKFDARYDYFSERHFDPALQRLVPSLPDGLFSLQGRYGSEHLGFYASDRFRPVEAVTIDLGFRYDQHTFVDDDLFSPRLSAAWQMRPGTVLRLAWGHFSQSQRAYELMVEDGDTQFYPAERSQHWVGGVEHLFPLDGRFPLSSVRLETYRRAVQNPRPRYENLFQRFETFPEGEFDRVRIAPERAAASGIELVVRGRPMQRLDWWLNYAYASTSDRVDGIDVRRRFDQTHTFNLDLNYRVTPEWNLNLAGIYHTGWPMTPVTLDPLASGPRNSERVPDYNRIDARVSRSWEMAGGTLSAFFDARNLTGRKNIAGLEIELDEAGGPHIRNTHWPGFFATAGITWEFR